MESRPETLVILSPGFAASEQDTTCIPPMQLFVKALREDCPGLNVVLIAFQYPHFTGQYKWNGVRVIAIGGRNRGQFYRLLTWTKAWRLLKQLNKEYQLMGILSFWLGECALVGSYFAKSHRLMHYAWVLGQDAKPGNKYVRWIKPSGDAVIALSDFTARELRKNYGIRPQQVIPVGIDTSLFGPMPGKQDIDLMGAGSLIPLKQYCLFVEAVAYLKDFFPAIKAIICGKGPEMDKLKEMADGYGLGDSLIFAGELPYDKVLAMMQRSKVFLHPSNYEGFGAVMAEALYAGAHVVSFCKPMDKIYRNHHIVCNAETMKQELLSILQNTRRGHDRVLTCTAQQIAKNIISLFVA